jgi:hypothetical protein
MLQPALTDWIEREIRVGDVLDDERSSAAGSALPRSSDQLSRSQQIVTVTQN